MAARAAVVAQAAEEAQAAMRTWRTQSMNLWPMNLWPSIRPVTTRLCTTPMTARITRIRLPCTGLSSVRLTIRLRQALTTIVRTNLEAQLLQRPCQLPSDYSCSHISNLRPLNPFAGMQLSVILQVPGCRALSQSLDAQTDREGKLSTQLLGSNLTTSLQAATPLSGSFTQSSACCHRLQPMKPGPVYCTCLCTCIVLCCVCV